MVKKIIRELCIYSILLIIIIPSTVSAICLTIKNMLWDFPDELYDIIAERLDNG